MDLSPIFTEFDTPFLVDTVVEDYPEGFGGTLEHGDESPTSTVCGTPHRSDDEEAHMPDEAGDAPRSSSSCGPSSILRRRPSNIADYRRVSFPEEEMQLATYKEAPASVAPVIHNYLPPDIIMQIYQTSCKQNQTIELDILKQVIMDIKNNTNHSAILNLSMVNITTEVNETLEAILKVANFRTLVLYECRFSGETINEFLNMIEYYESVCEIEVAMNFDEIAWKCFCQACTNNSVLEAVAFKGMVISDMYMRGLLCAVRTNESIHTLKFDACLLVKLPSFYLVENLITNTSLRELYLPSTGLYTKEADCLGRFLQRNFTLKVLDISNNFIGDRGLEVLARGLARQTMQDCGLAVLVVFNNQLTDRCGPTVASIISECKNLHTLNIGFNNLTDDVILCIGPSLVMSTSLEGLGLQCTLLTCKGIDALSFAIENNNSLQKINLKGNKAIQAAGLERLCHALTSSKIIRIEIDEINRSLNEPHIYMQLVKKINAICTVNRNFKETCTDEVVNRAQVMTRKVSLSCEPRYITPDTSSSHIQAAPRQPPKSRFKITKVPDSNVRPMSRFKVTRVLPSPEDELTLGRFANVRSSVSSNDSVDSLQLDDDSD